MTDPMTDPMAEQLVDWGKVIRLETRGRTSGEPAHTTVGYVEEPDGSLLVSAGDPEAHWALNLLAEPGAVVRLEDRRWPVSAELLDGPDRHRAIRELILRYGTPSEGLGRGPSFRLRPVAAQEPA